jgi:heme exporter protein A
MGGRGFGLFEKTALPVPPMTHALPARFDPVHVRAGGVTLSRGGRTLVKDLAFAAAPGDALVITGPNGSGKTTLLRAIAGFIRPDGGDIAVAPGENTQIAYLGHSEGLKPNETVQDALDFWAGLQGVPAEAVEPVMRRMAVAHLAKRLCGTLSAGQRRRTAIARLALSNAGLWILDEPTAPLDARSRERLGDLIADYRAAGGVVIATTHADLYWPDETRLDLTEASANARTPKEVTA